MGYQDCLVSQETAAQLIQQGELVAFGTETVYGLGADACNAQAVAQIYAKKQRPKFNPLIVHFPDSAQAFEHIEVNALLQRCAEAFWPGPMTLIAERKKGSSIAQLCSAGGSSLAVRVPSKAQGFLRAAARPVAAPSANRSGKLSPTKPQHVYASFGADHCPALLDLGSCEAGVESTIIDVRYDHPVLLRAGAIPLEAVEQVLGLTLPQQLSSDNPAAPGQLSAHYAPKVPLRMNVTAPNREETWITFGTAATFSGASFSLSPSGDLIEAAARLFDTMHLAQELGQPIAVMPIPKQGLGLAINDRLTRAAQR